MKRISSQSTYFYKRVFPVFWFGFLVIFVIVAVLGTRRGDSNAMPMLIISGLMLILGYVLSRKLLFDLADEVWDDGDALIVRNAGVEERVPLANIMNIGYSLLNNPERVTLTLRDPGPLGRDITFIPLSRAFTFRWMSRSPLIDDLIERVDRARRRANI